MARIIFLFLMTLSLAAGAPLRLMTFNLRYDNPADGADAWPRRREAVAGMVRFHGAEVLCLQEGLDHQVTFLAEALGWKRFGAGRDDGRAAGEHSAILYDPRRLTRLAGGTFWLSETPEQPGRGWDAACPRIATWARFWDRKGGVFFVFNTHLDHEGATARREGARLLAARIQRLAGAAPVILTGDFNDEEDSEACRVILGAGLRDAMKISESPHHGPRRTFPGFSVARAFAGGRIDYIFVSPQVKVKRHATLCDFTEELRFLSDHLPVLAEVELKPRG